MVNFSSIFPLTATTGDSDYIAKTGTLTFNPGETAKTITIEVKGDRKKEARRELLRQPERGAQRQHP